MKERKENWDLQETGYIILLIMAHFHIIATFISM